MNIKVRFRGGATQCLQLPLVLSAPDARRTPRHIVDEIDRLLNELTDAEVANELNARGFRSGGGLPFDVDLIRYVRNTYELKDRYARLRESGLLTISEMAERLGVTSETVRQWHRQGLLKGVPYKGRGRFLFYPPPDDLPPKGAWKNAWIERNVQTEV